MIRAPVAVKAIAAHRRRALVGWGLVIVGGPLACWILNVLMQAALLAWPTSMLPYASQVLLNIGVNATLAVSLQLINGYTGQFSLGHAGFMAVGAYGMAALMFFVRPLVLGPTPAPFLAAVWFGAVMVLCGLLAAVFGLLVGIPSLRLKGDYLAIVTLGFGEIIRVIILNTESLGGARGFTDLDTLPNALFWVLLLLLAAVVVTRNMVASTRGLAFLAVGTDEIAAEAIGINTTRYKVSAFVVGAFFAGAAGAVYGGVQAYLNPSVFDFVKSMEVVAMVVLGGLGSIPGAVVAAFGLTLLPELLRGGFMPAVLHDAIPDRVWSALPNWRMVIYSLILIGAMLIQSRGAGRARGRKRAAAAEEPKVPPTAPAPTGAGG
ncbi:MAG TPA: branched-chain amino acid ABC transporter permease [bacterium]|nr:branched-chain amino acid ABC transporter permease [bacterium]